MIVDFNGYPLAIRDEVAFPLPVSYKEAHLSIGQVRGFEEFNYVRVEGPDGKQYVLKSKDLLRLPISLS